MAQFTNDGAECAFRDGEAAGVPSHIAHRAGWMIHLLLAANSLQDVAIIGRIALFANSPGRMGLLVEAKWFVTFEWTAGVGALEVGLERR